MIGTKIRCGGREYGITDKHQPGYVCTKHPELQGWRRKNNGRCLACDRESLLIYIENNKEKVAAYKKAWHEAYRGANKDCIKAKKKAWYEANKEQKAASGKAWREANKDHIKAKNKAWRDARPGWNNAAKSRRRAAKLCRIPKWADRNAISAFYNACPPGMTIDHIVPLQGELVSGLHVIENLQYLPPAENFAKCNKFDTSPDYSHWHHREE